MGELRGVGDFKMEMTGTVSRRCPPGSAEGPQPPRLDEEQQEGREQVQGQDVNPQLYNLRGTESDVKRFIQWLASSEPGVFVGPKTLIANRYVVVGEEIGSGGSANVFKVWDADKNTYRALKVCKAEVTGGGLTLPERELLVISSILRTGLQKESDKYIVRLYHALVIHRYLLYVYDLLGPTIREVLIFNKGKGFSLKDIQHIGFQLVSGINFLHTIGVIHHDIKPENVAFLQQWNLQNGTKVLDSTEIRILDLGSATLVSKGSQPVATTRNYRSPETDFLGFSRMESDIWCAGLTLYELFTGSSLFQCRNRIEKVFQLTARLGHIPVKLAKVSRLKECFDANGILTYDETTQPYWVNNSCCKLESLMSHYRTAFPQSALFFDLLGNMIVMHPVKRWTAEKLLQHPFWTQSL